MEKKEAGKQLLFEKPLDIHIRHKILQCNSEDLIKIEFHLNSTEWQMATSQDARAEQVI